MKNSVISTRYSGKVLRHLQNVASLDSGVGRDEI